MAARRCLQLLLLVLCATATAVSAHGSEHDDMGGMAVRLCPRWHRPSFRGFLRDLGDQLRLLASPVILSQHADLPTTAFVGLQSQTFQCGLCRSGLPDSSDLSF